MADSEVKPPPYSAVPPSGHCKFKLNDWVKIKLLSRLKVKGGSYKTFQDLDSFEHPR